MGLVCPVLRVSRLSILAPSVSQTYLNIFKMFKIIALSITTLFTQLYVRVDILLTCGNHLHDRITSLRVEVLVHKASLAMRLFTEVLAPN